MKEKNSYESVAIGGFGSPSWVAYQKLTDNEIHAVKAGLKENGIF